VELLADYFIRHYNRLFLKNISALSPAALDIFYRYTWPGNVRELENVIKRALILCETELITPELLPQEIKDGCGFEDYIVVRPGATFEEVEKELLLKTLQKVNGNKQEAAQILGISRKSMYNKINKYNRCF
jgi:two-component system response regulator HydG